jgi:hypothetical protein
VTDNLSVTISKAEYDQLIKDLDEAKGLNEQYREAIMSQGEVMDTVTSMLLNPVPKPASPVNFMVGAAMGIIGSSILYMIVGG